MAGRGSPRQTWLAPVHGPAIAVHGLAIGLVLFAATWAGAEGDLQVAQAEATGSRPAQEGEAGVAEPRPPAQAPEEKAPEPRPAQGREPEPPSGIEEIVVHGAESEASEDFAKGDSVTGFGAEDLAALGAQNIADLATFTPNLEIVTAGATTPTFFIRGVGLNDFNANSTGAVAIYQDDVAINAPAIQLGTLFDVEGVNILRGPQGTGLARNASAGAIKIYSRKPTGEFSGYLRSDFGNYDYRDFEGAVEAPIYEDLLAARTAFRFTQRDGTMLNRCAGAPPFEDRVAYPGPPAIPVDSPWSLCGEPVLDIGAVSSIPEGLAKHVNNINNWAARGTLLFQPTLDSTWLLNAHGGRRNELSRLGQSIGTGGNYCTDPTKICTAPFAGVPPDLRDIGGQSGGVLGGPENGTSSGANYSPREIRERLIELAPCWAFLSGPMSCSRQPLDVRLAANEAKIKLAKELAKHLDSQPWQGDFNLTGPTKLDSYGFYLKGNTVLPWGMEVATTTGYDTYDRFTNIDLDFSPETLFQIATKDSAWQVYQDLRIKGQIPGERGGTWEVGGFFLNEVLDATVNNNLGDLAATGVLKRIYNQNLWSAAGYGSFSFDFWKRFTLDGGVRFNWDQKSFDMNIFTGQPFIPSNCELVGLAPYESACKLHNSWQAPTGTIRLTYRFREDTLVYWKYNHGWKPGSYNATASQFTGPTIANPENIDAFETGMQGSWLAGRLGINTSLFYYSYSDYQIFTAQQYLGGTPQFVILNANDAEVYGAEVDAVARPWYGAFLNVRFSWLESQFLDFVRTDQFLASRGGGDLVVFRENQYSGNPLLNSPRFKVSLTAEQTLPLGRFGSAALRYDGVWTDTTYYDATKGTGLGNSDGEKFLPPQTIAQEPYWIHNLRLSWRAPGGRIEIAGWVRNLTNQEYKTFAFDGSTFRDTTIYFVGDPRTIGGTLVVNF